MTSFNFPYLLQIFKRWRLLSGLVFPFRVAMVVFFGSCTTTPEAGRTGISAFQLHYLEPASNWNEALPLGNGRLGAMVFGGVALEHIQFNEETLWTGEPRSYAHDGAASYLSDIRRLLFAGKQAEAEKLAQDNFMSVPLRQMAYQPFGDLYMEFDGHENFENYSRQLSLNDAINTSTYRVGDITYTRESLVSHLDNVIAIKIVSSEDRSLSFTTWLDAVHEQKSVVTSDHEQMLKVSVKDGVLFGVAKMRIETDGQLVATEDRLVVEGARTAVIYLTAATNYRRYDDVSNNPEIIVDDILKSLADKGFDEVKADHMTDYQKLFNRFDIDFGSNEKVDLPTNERLNQFLDGDPQLIALYIQYGRYLMISSSREGTHPANLQGIWNDNLAPAWDSKYTSNINLEMNYWISELTNLSETHEPLFRLIEDVAETGAVTARKHYNSRGWIIHHNTDLWRGTAPINNANHGIYLGCAGWLSHHLWEHYRYTQDTTFLDEVAYPLMKGAALFYVDNLVEDPHTGWLVSSPSNSPETGGLVYGPAMDHQIIRSLLKTCSEAAEVLQQDRDFAGDLKATLKKIAPDQIGKFGQLQEWVEDKDDTASHHRHVSHLWGLYPGEGINWDDNPELMEAAKRSLLFRGDEGTGWSLAWKINFWARFLDGDHAYKLIQLLFRPVTAEEGQRMTGGGSYPNLFDAHPPFQIDGNFGAPAGIIEMLMQSHRGSIDLLPALPQALPYGFVKGVVARGAFELSFRWDDSRLVSVDVLSRAGNPCTLRYLDKHITFETSEGKEYHLDGELLLQ